MSTQRRRLLAKFPTIDRYLMRLAHTTFWVSTGVVLQATSGTPVARAARLLAKPYLP